MPMWRNSVRIHIAERSKQSMAFGTTGNYDVPEKIPRVCTYIVVVVVKDVVGR